MVQSEPHVEAAEPRDTPASASGCPILVRFAAKRWHRWHLILVWKPQLPPKQEISPDFRGDSSGLPRPPTADMAMSFDRVQESWPENLSFQRNVEHHPDK